MSATATDSVTARLEHLDAVDHVSDPLDRVAGAVVPPGSRLKDVLSGTWLGHPLHPALTDVVVGSWTSAFLLDWLGGANARPAADMLVATGALAALPTAASGLSDWADTRGTARRLGTIHAVGNTAALALHVMSWRERRRGRRGRGRLLSGLGFGIANGSAWLGGHLSYASGVGVNQTAFDTVPEDWTPVLDASALPENELVGATAGTTGVVLVRRGAHVRALDDRCSHRGCALHEGELDGDAIRCRCHGSTFSLDGSVLKGPATAPQPVFDARIRDGRVEVRRGDAG